MGGRLDATNAVEPLCSVITGISLEHQQYLGDTIEKIAAEKAGIIKNGKPVFCAPMDKAAEKIISETAAEKKSPVHIADSKLNNISIKRNGLKFVQSFNIENFKIDLSMPGEAQRKNFKLAFAVLRYLSETCKFDLKTALTGLSAVKWPARFQQVPDGSIIDGAHNPEGAEYLVKFIEEYFPGKKFSVVFGNFADKATEDILGILKKTACEFIFVPLAGGGKRKCQSGEELAAILSKISDLPCTSAPSLDDVFNGKIELRSDKIFAGSLYLAGEVLSHYFTENEITDI
jgi:dihydrofolate synthase/folylpolyglutamate synthase